jgi:hypothetical protein
MEDAVGQVGEIGEIGDLRATSRGVQELQRHRNRSAQTVPFGGFANTAD